MDACHSPRYSSCNSFSVTWRIHSCPLLLRRGESEVTSRFSRWLYWTFSQFYLFSLALGIYYLLFTPQAFTKSGKKASPNILGTGFTFCHFLWFFSRPEIYYLLFTVVIIASFFFFFFGVFLGLSLILLLGNIITKCNGSNRWEYGTWMRRPYHFFFFPLSELLTFYHVSKHPLRIWHGCIIMRFFFNFPILNFLNFPCSVSFGFVTNMVLLYKVYWESSHWEHGKDAMPYAPFFFFFFFPLF